MVPGANVVPGVTWIRPSGPFNEASAMHVQEPSALRLNVSLNFSIAVRDAVGMTFTDAVAVPLAMICIARSRGALCNVRSVVK